MSNNDVCLKSTVFLSAINTAVITNNFLATQLKLETVSLLFALAIANLLNFSGLLVEFADVFGNVERFLGSDRH